MGRQFLSKWRKLPVSPSELCLDTTLRCGQSFRWQKISDEWTCTLHGRILSLKQDSHHLHYKVTWPEFNDLQSTLKSTELGELDDDDGTEELLRRYFSLHLNLGVLYEQWSEADSNFQQKAPKFAGVRILSQDAWEALICFICSSNNNISRISQMVHKLCKRYGPLIGNIGDESMHDFPAPEALVGKNIESQLRALGFGYRAKYIADTARIIAQERPVDWLESFRNPQHPGLSGSCRVPSAGCATYREAHEALRSLAGVGPKVADCVCLMGLGWGESVPVDTHVWQIAQRDYRFGKTKSKTFNKIMYDAVGDHFRKIWGDYAGWAHSVLFTADLREFSGRKGESQDLAKRQVKFETVEEEGGAGGLKKRTTVEAKVESGTKVEEGADVKTLQTVTSYKRRRTRQNT